MCSAVAGCQNSLYRQHYDQLSCNVFQVLEEEDEEKNVEDVERKYLFATQRVGRSSLRWKNLQKVGMLKNGNASYVPLNWDSCNIRDLNLMGHELVTILCVSSRTSRVGGIPIPVLGRLAPFPPHAFLQQALLNCCLVHAPCSIVKWIGSIGVGSGISTGDGGCIGIITNMLYP
ncbi:hypothetical protein HAX54_012360 [Datura stramonium]|uniref:Uncharacterized protein n=1 Tax=Datura stramonium TaxID=4076 RepID=A0ABS8TJM9_DATST|nr:hypothetical protein [Datura stramonium]